MPVPRKLDLIPDALRKQLEAALMARGFAEIVKVTEELNFWLEAEGLEVRIGKTAVGEFSLLLKRQRDAFSVSKHVLAEMEIGEESAIYQTLFQLVAAQAVHLVKARSDADEVIDKANQATQPLKQPRPRRNHRQRKTLQRLRPSRPHPLKRIRLSLTTSKASNASKLYCQFTIPKNNADGTQPNPRSNSSG